MKYTLMTKYETILELHKSVTIENSLDGNSLLKLYTYRVINPEVTECTLIRSIGNSNNNITVIASFKRPKGF